MLIFITHEFVIWVDQFRCLFVLMRTYLVPLKAVKTFGEARFRNIESILGYGYSNKTFPAEI